MKHKRFIFKDKTLWALVDSQCGRKEGYTTDADVNTDAEVAVTKAVFKTDNVQKGTKVQDFQGIDTFVDASHYNLGTLAIQVKCTRNPHLVLEDKTGKRRLSCWDNCKADRFLWAYACADNETVLISEYDVAEIKECLKQVREKHAAFPNGYNGIKTYWGTLGFGKACFKVYPDEKKGYSNEVFEFWRGDDPRDR